MSDVIDLSLPALVILYALLAVPFFISFYLRLHIIKPALISVFRMTIQLSFVGFYLEYLFRYNNPWVNIAWVLIMMLVANWTVVTRARLKLTRFFLLVFCGLLAGTAFVVGFLLFLTIRPQPLWDAHYLVPITGMILGNCLRANVISLERFYSSVREREKEYNTYLLLGATLREAANPFVRPAVKAALSPTISTMATIGIVSLPGMMTGQILGGSSPLVAIKYQLAIMVCIFCAISITSIINVFLSMKVAFNEYHTLRRGIFR
jgi:putative ABC transport system permease protein